MAKKNSAEYWAERIAAGTWEIYNSTEEKNRKLLEMYKDASQRITNELYRLAEKLQKQGFKNTDVYRNNQLVKLNVEILKAIKQLGGNAEAFEQKSMFSAFAENYEMIGDMIGGADFAMPNKGAMEKMMQRPWRGDDFSSRLWKNTKKLSSVLNDILQHGIQQGKTVTEIAVDIDNQMQAGFNAAHRLVRTETMHVLSESSKEGYKAAGVKKIQFWAAEDERTCDRCGKLHGKVYDFDSAPVLPLHPNCRCTYLPVMDMNFEDSQEFILEGQEYKKIIRGSEEEFQLKKNESIIAQKVETYDTDVFVSVNASIKPKALHTINKNTEDAMKEWGISYGRKPKIVIADYSEMSKAYGKYDAIHNIVYYLPQIADSDVVDNVGDIEFHEMWHMKQAEIFREKAGEITDENFGEYIKYACKAAKKKIDGIGITEYNVNKLSVYASKMFFIERYDEVEAEYKTLIERVGKQW